MGFADFFTSHQKFPAVSGKQQQALLDWFRMGPQGGGWRPGSGARMEMQALTDLFNQVKEAQTRGTPFYESLIPSAPGALSPAAAAEKAASMDALQSQLGSERVAQAGQLGREYGGRLPASMVQSGFGNLARAGAGGATDIARQSILENINLGEQGVQGLASLSTLGTVPLGTYNSLLGGSTAGGFVAPPIGKEVGETISSLAGAAKGIAGGIAGFAGLGGKKPQPGGGGISSQYATGGV